MKSEAQFGQVLVSARDRGFELRHVDDRDRHPQSLRQIPLAHLREWAREDAKGRFRPLSGAPDLKLGWRVDAESASELEQALDQVYPGGMADWFHHLSESPPVTDFPEFARRQTGIYRGVAALDPAAVQLVVGACCDPRFCIKRRLWSGPGLDPDGVSPKSAIPCLEPCAVLLEFARRCARIEQEPRAGVELGVSDWHAVIAGLEAGLRASTDRTELRAGDLADPSNPRRLFRALNRLRQQLPADAQPVPGSPD